MLFDRNDRDRVHGSWRQLLCNREFHHRPGLTPDERTALSYQRLQLVNGMVDDAGKLANDPYRLASLHEWTGVLDGALGTFVGIHYNLFLGTLLDHDADGRRDLSDYTSMRCTGTFLCTEIGHGNDVAALETTAELDSATGDFVLHTPTPSAQKFMPNSSPTGGPKSAIVAARLVVDGRDLGVFLFLAPLTDKSGPLPGVQIRRLPERTGDPVDHCLTAFRHVRLPRSALLEAAHGHLDAEGLLSSSLGSRRQRFLRSIGRVTLGKICMSAAGVGVSRAALTIAVRYAHQRHIGGARPGERVPLTAHRSHHSRLLRALATAYAMTFLHRRVTSRWARHTAEDRAEAERQVAVAKSWITWQARTITTECRERCGAQGLFLVNGLAAFPPNVEGTITAEGDNLVLWVKAAAEMIFGHQVDSNNPCDFPVTDQALTDLHVLRGLLATVEGIWQARARVALRKGPAGDPLGRWNAASSTALEMVATHARLDAADAFLEAVGQTVDPVARSLLENLCRLFLLDQLVAHTGDLLAEGRLTTDHVRALPGVVETVIGDLAPHMMTLVDAFDLPPEFLAEIPIADGGYVDSILEGDAGE